MSELLYTKSEIERTDKGMVAVASTAVVDRQGEIVSVDGWELKNFKKNPVMLWAHDHQIPAIGTAKNLRIEGTGKRAKLVFEPEFHEHTDFAKAIKKMYEDKIINSFSVGFQPIDMDGNTYTKQELLEISGVNVPANHEARVMAYKTLKKAGFDTETIKSVGIDEEEVAAESNVEALKAEIAELKGKYEEVVKGLVYLNPQGRKQQVIKDHLSYAKVIARASDKLFADKAKMPESSLATVRVVKRAAEKLIVNHKQELQFNGQNQRTSRKG